MKKHHLKRKRFWFIGFVMLTVLGTGGFFTWQWYFKKEVRTNNTNSVYSAFARGRVDVDGSIVKLSASKDGVVKELLVEEGGIVKKGQVLCKQDDMKERLVWENCKAAALLAEKKLEPIKVSLDAAKRELKRHEKLIKNEVISKVKWDEVNDLVNHLNADLQVAEAEFQIALATQRQAEYDMELKTIRAPDNGKILRTDIRPGYGISTLNVTVLFLFVPNAPFIVRAEIEEKFIKSIKPGVVADIIPDSDETKTYKAKVIKVGNYLGPKRQVLDEPNERNDVRTTECILSIEDKDLILGQRVLVKFKKLNIPKEQKETNKKIEVSKEIVQTAMSLK